MIDSLRRKMQAAADYSEKEPKSRKTLYLSIICTYLVLIVCVQFALIITLKSETKVADESNDCGSVHTSQIVKRQIGRGSQMCPPGCVRRRRKRPFEAIVRPESTIHPFSTGYRPGESGQPGWPGEIGRPGESGQPGWPGEIGRPGESGQPGWPGEIGRPGESGQPGWPGEIGRPGESGQPGWPGEIGRPGESGQPSWPGESGQPGWPGESGRSGLQGPPGGQGSPGRSGSPGSPGGPGHPGSPGQQGGRGLPGQAGQRGYHGALGPSGDREHGFANTYNYETHLGPSLRSGQRGDQRPTEHPYYAPTVSSLPKNITSASSLLKEFRLYPHPECKDEVNHRALMDTLKDKGKVSFMILVDLQDNEYCIVHS